MEYRQLGRSGLRVSALCLGTMTFGGSQGFMKGVGSSDEEAHKVLDRALSAGIDFLDTADIYSEGRSEELLGKWLGERRKDLLLATKCRFPMSNTKRPMDQGLSRRHILDACEQSLKRLRTEWIDLYQVHMQDGSTGIEETMRALEDLVRSGKVRYIGCSNYTAYRLTESLWVSDRRHLARFESVQLQWSLLERGAEREVLPACREFGLGTMIWSPLARGLLSGKYRKGEPPPKGARLEQWKDTYARFNNDRTWDVVDALVDVAEQVQASPSQVALAWLLQKPECTSVVIGARDVRQLEDNLKAVDVKLSADQLERLDKITAPVWGYPYDFIGVRERW